MRLVRTYTVQESWENDTLGNVDTIYTTVLKDLVEADAKYNVFIAVFENNNSQKTVYKVDFIEVVGSSLGRTNICSVRDDRRNSSTSASASRSLYASAGTIIKVYMAF